MEPYINVLLIDDNPDYAFGDKEIVPGIPQGILNDERVTDFPWVSAINHSKNINDFERLNNVENLFRLKWLQLHTDVYEYRNMSLDVKLKFGLKKLEEVGYVPDIIVFDYALTDTKQETPSVYLNFLKNKEINKFLNPNIQLREFLYGSSSDPKLLPQETGYNDDSPIKKHMTNNDSYGLYCGTMIAEMYKYEKPLAAIPVTRKGKKTIEDEPDPAFFEWLTNNSYHKIFDRKLRTSKDWNSILNDALHVYRLEILNLITLGKIEVDLINLIVLLNGSFLSKAAGSTEISCLITHGEYGTAAIPIEGLFIDKSVKFTNEVPDELRTIAGKRNVRIRDVKIWNFLNLITKTVIGQANVDIKLTDISRAIEIADLLYSTYLENFEKRVDLSDYTNRSGKLDDAEKESLEDLLKHFAVTSKNKIGDSVVMSITNYTPTKKPEILRFVIFYLIGKVSVRWSELSVTAVHLGEYKDLDEQEIYYLLNPVVNIKRGKELLLPMHFTNSTEVRKVLDSFYLDICRQLAKTVSPPPRTKGFSNFNLWITPGEKLIVRNLLNAENKFLPQWLR